MGRGFLLNLIFSFFWWAWLPWLGLSGWTFIQAVEGMGKQRWLLPLLSSCPEGLTRPAYGPQQQSGCEVHINHQRMLWTLLLALKRGKEWVLGRSGQSGKPWKVYSKQLLSSQLTSTYILAGSTSHRTATSSLTSQPICWRAAQKWTNAPKSARWKCWACYKDSGFIMCDLPFPYWSCCVPTHWSLPLSCRAPLLYHFLHYY